MEILCPEEGGALPVLRGEYVCFLCAGDRWSPDFLEKMAARGERTGADVVVCDFLEHYADGREQTLPACFQDHPLSAAGSSCNKIFRRSLIGDLRFPEGLWYEDFYFSAVMLVRAAKTAYVREPLYIYRRGQESTMHNNNAAKNLDMLRIMEMLEKELIPLGRRSDFEFFLINHVILDSISRLARQETPEKAAVIRTLRRYAQQKLPQLTRCESFRAETRNRRIIMFLNYHGLEKTAQMILRAKSRI